MKFLNLLIICTVVMAVTAWMMGLLMSPSQVSLSLPVGLDKAQATLYVLDQKVALATYFGAKADHMALWFMKFVAFFAVIRLGLFFADGWQRRRSFEDVDKLAKKRPRHPRDRQSQKSWDHLIKANPPPVS